MTRFAASFGVPFCIWQRPERQRSRKFKTRSMI